MSSYVVFSLYTTDPPFNVVLKLKLIIPLTLSIISLHMGSQLPLLVRQEHRHLKVVFFTVMLPP